MYRNWTETKKCEKIELKPRNVQKLYVETKKCTKTLPGKREKNIIYYDERMEMNRKEKCMENILKREMYGKYKV